MADTAPEKTESMEEILQSIKRIMDDDSEAPPTAKESDVFDLTNVVKGNETMDETPAAPKSPSTNPEAVLEPAKPVADSIVPAKHDPEMGDGLVSEQAAAAAATSFRKVAAASQKDHSLPHIPSPHLRNGNTVEDLVIETLRPMLKDWLDAHLPVIVQKIVEKEVKRIVSLHLD